MSNLLLGDYPIPVSPELACAVGLNEAIVLQQIHYWTEHNQAQGKALADGQYWVYNSYTKWKEQFPWWSERTIQRIFASLEKRGLIVSSTHNKLKMDRTKWYRIDYARLNQIVPLCQAVAMDNSDLASAIPETKSELTNTERKVTKEQSEELPTPVFTNNDTSRIQKKESIFASVTRRFGPERTAYMLSVVDWYIDKAYPFYTGINHPDEGTAKRMVFAEKLLLCSDSTVEDDYLILEAMHRALKGHSDNCDPTIYYITTSNVLGYWLIQDEDVGYESVYDTEYAPVETMY